MNQKLTEGNISKTKPPILEVIKYLKELKSAWAIVEEKAAKGNIDSNKSQNNKNNNEENSDNSNIKLNTKG